jgi:hypothetical protein
MRRIFIILVLVAAICSNSYAFNIRYSAGTAGTGSGDVIGPASSTDNAVVRYDGTTGKIIQDTSFMTIDDGGKVVLTSTLNAATGNEAAYTLNYTTNKATSGNDTGLLINQTDTLSPGTSLLIDAQVGGSSKFSVTNGGTVTGVTIAAGSSYLDNAGFHTFNYKPFSRLMGLNVTGADITDVDSVAIDILYGTAFKQTSGHNRAVGIYPTYNQTSGTSANTDLIINRVETAIGSGAQLLADFQVGSSSYFAFSNKGAFIVPITIVTPGTTGNTTINNLAGRVNIAAAGTSVTVTNSLVTANSIIVATAATNDATGVVKNVVAAAGSFVINVVGVTAETAFNWIVISQ